MAAESLLPQRRLLLLLALLLAGCAALAGGLTASLLLRGRAPAPAAAPLALAAMGCASSRPSLPVSDPTAALDAALGRPTARLQRAETADSVRLAGLLAAPAQPTLAPPTLAQATPTMPLPTTAPPPATPPPAAAAAPAAPPIVAGYTLDLGYFLVPEQAVAFATRVQERGVPVLLLGLPDASGRVWTHVRTPPFAGSAQALAGAERIERVLGVSASLVPPAATLSPPATTAGAPRP